MEVGGGLDEECGIEPSLYNSAHHDIQGSLVRKVEHSIFELVIPRTGSIRVQTELNAFVTGPHMLRQEHIAYFAFKDSCKYKRKYSREVNASTASQSFVIPPR